MFSLLVYNPYFSESHDLCSTHERQEKSITYDDIVHRDSEALDDNVS